LRFSLPGEPLEAELVAIYSQARFQTRFWLEGVFTPGALDPYITRYIGSAVFAPGKEIGAMSSLGEFFPNVVSIRTAKIIEAARSVLDNATILFAVGARMSAIAQALMFEYAVLAMILTVFASLVGSVIAGLILTHWLKLPLSQVIATGISVAAIASSICLLAGALWMLKTLTLNPSGLLRRGA